ncbi:MAG: hypothetical protein ACOCVV_05280 [Marinobacter sp.]
MSKALAFVTGTAVIIALLLFLFTPGSETPTEMDPVNESGAGETDDDRDAATARPSDDARAPGVRSGNQMEEVSRWPDPSATKALPERPDNPARNARPVTSLWDADNATTTEVDGFPATKLQADPDALTGLHVGQQVALQVPALDRTLTARLNTTSNQLNNIQVFHGSVGGGHDHDNVVITRGQRSTYVVLSTREGTYSAVIDNGSGETVLTSEGDIQDNLAGHDDAIPVPGIDQEPPGDPSG